MTTAEHTPAIVIDASLSERIRTWALVALVLYVINMALFVAVSTVGGIWFTVSDVFGLLLAVNLMILVMRFDDLFRPGIGNASRTARWIGIVGMGIAIAGSIILLSSQAGHEFVPGGGGLGMQFVGWGLLGVWFLMISSFARRAELFSTSWAWAARIAGASSVAAMLMVIPFGPDSLIAASAFGIAFIAIVFWVVFTRRDLKSAV